MREKAMLLILLAILLIATVTGWWVHEHRQFFHGIQPKREILTSPRGN